MITHYLSMPLKDLERVAYREQNTLALAMLEVCEGEGIDPDDYANLEKRIEELEDALDASENEVVALQRERDDALEKLSNLEAEFQQACDELHELNLEKES